MLLLFCTLSESQDILGSLFFQFIWKAVSLEGSFSGSVKHFCLPLSFGERKLQMCCGIVL